jgi:hypothetical protein
VRCRFPDNPDLVRRVTSLLILLVMAVAGVTATPAEAATKVKRFSPWTADGDPKVRRWFHGSGECARNSRFNSRRQAWRCVSGNIALDPCFESPTDAEVLCVASPWARRGHLLSAVLEPDNRGRSPAVGPWAIEVAGRRRRCVFVRRPSRRGKRRPSYRCGRRGPYLFGRANRRRSTWTIRIADSSRGSGLRRVRIRVAWL